MHLCSGGCSCLPLNLGSCCQSTILRGNEAFVRQKIAQLQANGISQWLHCSGLEVCNILHEHSAKPSREAPRHA